MKPNSETSNEAIKNNIHWEPILIYHHRMLLTARISLTLSLSLSRSPSVPLIHHSRPVFQTAPSVCKRSFLQGRLTLAGFCAGVHWKTSFKSSSVLLLHIELWQHVSCGFLNRTSHLCLRINKGTAEINHVEKRKEMCGRWKYYIMDRDSQADDTDSHMMRSDSKSNQLIETVGREWQKSWWSKVQNMCPMWC